MHMTQTSSIHILGDTPIYSSKYGGMMYTDSHLYKRQFNSWEDLEAGKIAEPNAVVRYEEKYARPGLTNHIPVDEDGNLISPLQSKYAKEYIASYTKLGFKFGDQAPTESAWRNSSDYGFSFVKARLLNEPAKFMGLAWDTSRIKKKSCRSICLYRKQKINIIKRFSV